MIETIYLVLSSIFYYFQPFFFFFSKERETAKERSVHFNKAREKRRSSACSPSFSKLHLWQQVYLKKGMRSRIQCTNLVL